jgi:hypothetical protein
VPVVLIPANTTPEIPANLFPSAIGVIMSPSRLLKAGAALAVFMLIVFAAMLSSTRVAKAIDDDDNDRNESKVRKGFQIAPVHLNLAGKNQELVGLGSYIVNAQIPCNDCHDAGPPTQFAKGGNPFMGQPTMINAATYLGGGRDFGAYPTPTSPLHIISRNLTPDKTGLPEGGRSFNEFLRIMRTGADLDGLHPNCSATLTTNCLTPLFKGELLQIMPWEQFQNMTEHDLRAIYEYLSAIPCIEGPAMASDLPPAAQYAFPALHNDCH